jgi:hypothetical protein
MCRRTGSRSSHGIERGIEEALREGIEREHKAKGI